MGWCFFGEKLNYLLWMCLTRGPRNGNCKLRSRSLLPFFKPLFACVRIRLQMIGCVWWHDGESWQTNCLSIPKQIRVQMLDLTSCWITKSCSSCQPFKCCGLSMYRNMFLPLRRLDGVSPTCEMLRDNVFWFSKNTVVENHYSSCNVNQVS